MKTRWWGTCALGLMVWALAQPAAADSIAASGDKTVVEKLLDIMLASGQIDRAQYDDLLDQARSEQEQAAVAVAAAAETPPVSEPGPTWDFSWSNGFKLERSDGYHKLKFGGRIMTDAAMIWEDQEARDTFGDDGSGVEFRRARIFFSGTVYDRVFFKMQYEFAQADDDDNPDFKDVFIGLKDLGPIGSAQVGHFKHPMHLQEWTSSKYTTFMERGLVQAFFPERDVGVMAMNNAFDDKLLWQLAAFRDTNDQGFAFDEWGDGSWEITARVSGAPIYLEEGKRVLHLGVSYGHQFTEETVRYRSRPASHLASRYVDTGSIDANGVDLLSTELAGVWGPLHATTEFTASWVEGRGSQPDVHFWGTYAQVGWFITGETRNYELGDSRWGRIKPRHDFDPSRGEWGAWEVAARFSYLNLDDGNVDGGKLWDVTAGLNWYLFPNLRLMFNYVHAEADDREYEGSLVSGIGDIFEMRAQIDF